MDGTKYMTVGETMLNDISCVLVNIWMALEYVFVYIICAIGTIGAIVLAIIVAFVQVDTNRRSTQWYYGTDR